MAANISKKEIKELFVSNLKGTTLNENYLIILLPLLLQCCHSFWILNFFQLGWGDFKGNVLINFLSVVLPFVLSITVFSDYLSLICLVLSILAIIAAFNSIILSKANKYSIQYRITVHKPIYGSEKLGMLLTSQLRGCIFVSAAVCILAVDMPIFPRRFAKTETYGTGVMDLGVGTFALLMGLLSSSNTKYRRFLYQLVILVFLGALRLFIVKFFDYNEHKSEYGVHWNFFFTLAVVKVAGLFLYKLSSSLSRVTVSILVFAAFQHFFLSNLGYEDTCLQDKVDRGASLLIANKEGLISLFGYVLLWLIGRLFCLLMSQKRMWYIGLILWSIVGHIVVDYYDLSVSRRCANISYTIWTSVCVSGSLLIVLIFDVIMNCLEDRANYVNRLECSDIYSIVNRRSLLHFLLANAMTGVANMFLDFQTMGSPQSVLVLLAYTAAPILCIHVIDLLTSSNGYKDD